MGDRLEVIVPHCDPVVNLYDQIYGIRKDKVEVGVADHRAREVTVNDQKRHETPQNTDLRTTSRETLSLYVISWRLFCRYREPFTRATSCM